MKTPLRIPTVIKLRFTGRGAFIGIALAAFATIATAAAFGVPGLIALSVVLLLAVAAEFWRELLRAEDEVTRADAQTTAANRGWDEALAQAEEAERRHAVELDEAREQYRTLRSEAVRLEQDNAELRRSMETSYVSLKRMLSATEAHIQAIDRTAESRDLYRQLGSYEWPAVSVTGGREIEVVAHVEPDATILEGQPLLLIAKQFGGVIGTATAKSKGRRQIAAVFPTREISRFARSRLRAVKELDPDPFSLRLQAFDGSSPLASLEDEELRAVRESLRNLQAVIAASLLPPEREDSDT